MHIRSILLSLAAAFLLTAGSLATVVAQEATPATTAPDAMLSDTFGLPELQISFDGATFSGLPSETAAGWHVVTFTNDSSDFGAVGFVQLPEGQTMDALFPAGGMDMGEGGMDMASPDADSGDAEMGDMASPMAGGDDPFAWLYEAYIAGGVGAATGQTVQGIVDLRAGDYAVWADDPSLPITPVALTVTGDASMASPVATDITADLTLVEIDTEQGFDFQVSGSAAAGPVLIEIRNDSSQPHFVALVYSPNAISEDQVAQLLTLEEGGEVPEGLPNPEDLIDSFYASVQSTGTVQYVAANLEVGYYVALCFVPDPNAGGIPHAFEGMIEIFEVTA